MKSSLTALFLLGSSFLCVIPAFTAEKPDVLSKPQLPKPDGKPADITKPVQVFILLGQSNMVGLGKVKGGDGSLEFAVKEKKKYP